MHRLEALLRLLDGVLGGGRLRLGVSLGLHRRRELVGEFLRVLLALGVGGDLLLEVVHGAAERLGVNLSLRRPLLHLLALLLGDGFGLLSLRDRSRL